MKVFIWECVGSGLTGNYHSGGGVTVIAKDLERAYELLRQRVDDPKNCDVFASKPDFTASVVETEEKVFIFPDAGCC